MKIKNKIKYNKYDQHCNGSKTKYEYNANNFRLTRLLTTRNTGIDILQDINYTYDPEGNIVEIIDNSQQTHYFDNAVIEPKSLYEYDALYRLKKATGRELSSLQMPSNNDFANNIATPNTASDAMQNYTQEFDYDELGNINQMQSVGNWTRDYVYDTATNRFLKHNPQQTENDYTYDTHGNTTKMPHLQELKYDYADQLNEVTLNASGNKAYYIYDAEGERVRKVIEKGNIKEERFYIGDYEVYKKTTNGTLNVERETLHINDDKQKVALIDYDGTMKTVRYQLTNHLDSASLELDETGAIITYEEYHPFGTTSYRSGRNEIDVSLKRYKYVHKELDNETGLYYYGMRYYAPWIARFISVDPLQFKYPELTPFQYASNRPISGIDMDGAEFYNVIEYYSKGRKTITRVVLIKENQKQVNLQLKLYNEINDKPEGSNTLFNKYVNGKKVNISAGIFKDNFILEDKYRKNKSEKNMKVHYIKGSIKPKGTLIKAKVFVYEYKHKYSPSKPKTWDDIEKAKPGDHLFDYDIFIGNSDVFKDSSKTWKHISKIAKYLKDNPSISITIKGHTGETGGSDREGKNTWYESPINKINNQVGYTKNGRWYINLGDLMDLRAERIKEILQYKYKIDSTRIDTKRGYHYNRDSNRKAEIIINKN